MHLPSNRAFLVTFSDDEATTADGLKGRVEHVRSGQRLRFWSLGELQSFVIRILDEEQATHMDATLNNQKETIDPE